jgi:hypothetical protein
MCGNETIIHEPDCEVITAPESASAAFRKVWDAATAALDDGLAGELTWTPKKRTRSLEQNALMWEYLTDLSRQVNWYGQKLSPDDWKEVISAGLRTQRVVPGINGGFVSIGVRTSKMSVKEMSAMIELCVAFGAQHGVRFSAPEWRNQ